MTPRDPEERPGADETRPGTTRDATDHVLTEDELLDEIAEESFPGSDPPSTWAGPDLG